MGEEKSTKDMGGRELAKELGVGLGLLYYHAKKLGIAVGERTAEQHEQLVEAVRAARGGQSRKESTPPRATRSKPEASPRAPRPPAAVLPDETMRIIRAAYPDGIPAGSITRAVALVRWLDRGGLES